MRVSAGPGLPNGPITQLNPYLTRKPGTSTRLRGCTRRRRSLHRPLVLRHRGSPCCRRGTRSPSSSRRSRRRPRRRSPCSASSPPSSRACSSCLCSSPATRTISSRRKTWTCCSTARRERRMLPYPRRRMRPQLYKFSRERRKNNTG